MSSSARVFFAVLVIFNAKSLIASNTCNGTNPSKDDCCNGTLNKRFDTQECLLDHQTGSLKELAKLFLDSHMQASKNYNLTMDSIKHQRESLGSILKADLHRMEQNLAGTISSMVKQCRQQCPTSLSNAVSHQTAAKKPISGESLKTIRSCHDLKKSDKALLRVNSRSEPFQVLCMRHHHLVGNGWLVILHRVDGTSFNRNWIAYREGFGDIDGSFWLGLEKIHQLTSTGQYELLVEVADFEGNSKYARYTRFIVGDESRKYPLDQLGTYSGTAGDGLKAHLGVEFSTYDDDNDRNKNVNCALQWWGGWWYNSCISGSHLTGQQTQQKVMSGIVWMPFSNPWKTLKYTRMMIRNLD